MTERTESDKEAIVFVFQKSNGVPPVDRRWGVAIGATEKTRNNAERGGNHP